jgi:hypothetical protein
MGGEPALGRPPDASSLLRRDHLERMAERGASLALDLAEDEPAPAPHDQVELVAARPDVGADDAVSAQPVVQRRASLEAPAGSPRAQAADAGS